MWRKTNLYNSAKQQISAEYTLTETIRSKIYKKFEHIVTGDTCPKQQIKETTMQRSQIKRTSLD